MTEKEFQKLLEKYEKGLCTPKEEQLLEKFLSSFQQPPENTGWDGQELQAIGERIFKKIEEGIVNPRSTTFFLPKTWIWWAVAAVALGFGLYWVIRQFNENLRTSQPASSGVYAILRTKSDEQKKLQLSDGTLITLNENSILKYPPTLESGTERRVELIGEAYFAVAKDSLRPFIVRSGDIETVVLGTSFNIHARPESEKIAVALIEGSVKVTTLDKEELGLLQPNQQLIYSKTAKTVEQSNFRGNLVYAWKEEVILFEKATVREVITVLSEKYNTLFRIENENKIKSLLVYRVNTKQYRLAQIFEHITKVTDYRFTQNADGSITVKPK